MAAVRSMERAEVVVLLCDVDEGVSEQDAKILGLAEERVFKVLPFGLSADAAGVTASATFLDYCLGMFGEELAPEERPIVANLCRRLDGVALAIKMAAARAATIGLAAVDQRLEAQLAGLDAGWCTALARHRSLAAVRARASWETSATSRSQPTSSSIY